MGDGELTRKFAGPAWLRDIGIVSWMIVGVVLVVVGAISLLAVTSTIVMPVVTAFIIASVAAPVVAKLAERRVPRAAGAGLCLLAVVLVALVVGALILGGITSQSDDISSRLHAASQKVADWSKDLGVGDRTADAAKANADTSATDAGRTLLNGIVHIASSLASLAVFASFAAITLFFLLKDGPTLREAFERHAGVPYDIAHKVTEEMMRALRGYFAGVTIVAGFNALVIGGGALLLGVPLAGTIAIVTFVGGFIPYLGAWAAGAFAVLLALGSGGGDTALAMAVIALLGNGVLQQIVQPFAYGTALDLHPIVVLVLTIGAGCLFGTIGLILAAPVTSAIVRITRDLRESPSPTVTPERQPLAV